MAKQNPIYLIRVYAAKMLIEHAMKHYGLSHSDFNMPSDLFNYELKLMPLRDFEALLCKIEDLTQDPAYTAKLSQSTNLKQFGPFVQLIASSTNLGMAIKRVNTVHNAIQSGVQVNMLLSGSIAKWRFLSQQLYLKHASMKAFLLPGLFYVC
ncbi:AraC family transcriptional regulator ligand-binding domain-containing protein [Aliivibrio fischeri]